MIKKITAVVAMALMLTTVSCNKGLEAQQQSEAERQAQINKATHDELVAAVSDRDELLVLVNEIQQGLVEIKSLQNIVTVNTSETPDRRAIIKNDIAAIQQALADRKARLAELEKKLSSSNLYSAELKKTIASLNSQIEEQAAEIQRLTGELATAKDRIAHLDTQVDSLNSTVQNVTDERNAAEARATSLTTQLKTGYYVLGSKKELKEHKILEGRKDVLQGDFDKSWFTAVDKTTLRTINTYSKKCKVLTKQPKDSYRIEKNADKIKSIVILDPDKFWGVSNYLVIQTD